MADVKAIASYFISRSSEIDENDLTNLKLQKLLYYTQAEHYKNQHSTIFDEPIEAWKLGPVVNVIYQWLKGCGAYPITDFDISIDNSDLTDEDKTYLDSIWNKYYKYSAAYLVEKTHEAGSPWATTFEEHNRNKVIELDKLATAKLENEW